MKQSHLRVVTDDTKHDPLAAEAVSNFVERNTLLQELYELGGSITTLFVLHHWRRRDLPDRGLGAIRLELARLRGHLPPDWVDMVGGW